MSQLQTNPSSSIDVEDIFRYTSGSREPNILIVGEAWGREEAIAQKPFVGASGHIFDKMLVEAGLIKWPDNKQPYVLQREQALVEAKILLANVVNEQPPRNEFQHFVYPNDEKDKKYDYRGTKARPALRQGVERLNRLIAHVKPQLIIAAGNVPLWALSSHAKVATKKGYRLPSGITTWHGSETFSDDALGGLGGIPLLPVIHPAAIMREWGYRAITVHNLRRGNTYAGTAAWTRNQPQTWGDPVPPGTFRPNFRQVLERLGDWSRRLAAGQLWLSVDIETYRRNPLGVRFISCIGLCDETTELCIPLFYFKKVGDSHACVDYFTLAQERTIWTYLKFILEHPNVRIIGQNFMYDTEYFDRYYGIRAIVSFDTMVGHHLLWPGTPKALHELAKMYCEHYCYWKDESQEWDVDAVSAEDLWRYNLKDIRKTYEAAFCLMSAIDQEGLSELYSFQMEQWLLSRDMRRRGNLCDQKEKGRLRLELLRLANGLGEWLMAAVPSYAQFTTTGKPWYSSSQGCQRLFYHICGIKPILHKKTKQPTLDDAALEELKNRDDAKIFVHIIERIQALRSALVLVRNFLDSAVSADGRIRCTFNITGTKTFRWSSNETGFGEGTNLQNITKGDED